MRFYPALRRRLHWRRFGILSQACTRLSHFTQEYLEEKTLYSLNEWVYIGDKPHQQSKYIVCPTFSGRFQHNWKWMCRASTIEFTWFVWSACHQHYKLQRCWPPTLWGCCRSSSWRRIQAKEQRRYGGKCKANRSFSDDKR